MPNHLTITPSATSSAISNKMTKLNQQKPQAIWGALNDFREDYSAKDASGKALRLPDFPDVLIINKAKQTAKQWGEQLEL